MVSLLLGWISLCVKVRLSVMLRPLIVACCTYLFSLLLLRTSIVKMPFGELDLRHIYERTADGVLSLPWADLIEAQRTEDVPS